MARIRVKNLRLKYLNKLPTRGRSRYVELIEEFVLSGKKYAEVEGFEAKARSVYAHLQKIVKKTGFPVKVVMRKGRVFLVRQSLKGNTHMYVREAEEA